MTLQQKHLPQISYDDALLLMTKLHGDCVHKKASNTLLILQHDPVITRGRRIHDQPIPFQDKIEKSGIQVRNADRGGLLTYHGPGQIVVYFVVKFEDYFQSISEMVKKIETILLEFLKSHKIEGTIDPDHPGIWVGSQKIASIGLRVSEGVTRHGISLNVSNDLDVYSLFNPCGLSGDTMTSMSKTLGKTIESEQVWQLGEQLGIAFAKGLQKEG